MALRVRVPGAERRGDGERAGRQSGFRLPYGVLDNPPFVEMRADSKNDDAVLGFFAVIPHRVTVAALNRLYLVFGEVRALKNADTLSVKTPHPT